MFNKKFTILLIAFFILIISVSTSYSAKQGLPSFGVQPTKIEFDNAKKTQTQEAIVLNLSNKPIKVRVYLNDFVFTDNPKRLYIYTEKRLSTSIAPFINFSPKQFVVPAKGQKKVQITFRNSGQRMQVGKYSALLFEVEGQMKKEAKVAIAARIATTIFGLPSKRNMAGQIKFFKANSSLGLKQGIFGVKGDPNFVLSYANTGNTHLNVSGEIYVRNFMGKLIQTIKFPEYEVYPGLTRTINFPWSQKSIGYFTADAKVIASVGDKNIKDKSESKKFFFMPFWIVLAIPLFLIAIFLYFRAKRRKKV